MRSSTRLFAVLLLTAATVGCGSDDKDPTTPTQQFGSVQGTARDQTSAAVGGATVTLTASGQATLTQTSGSDGAYLFSQVPTGNWTVTLAAPAGYTIAAPTKQVTVTANNRATVDAFALTKTPVTPANSAAVDMLNSQFVPATVTIVRGGTVTWTNRDAFDHNVSGIAGVNAGNFGLNGTRSFTFANAGTFNYTCTLHQGMNGTVVVQ